MSKLRECSQKLVGGGGTDEKLGDPQKKLEVKGGVFEKYKNSQGGYLKLWKQKLSLANVNTI